MKIFIKSIALRATGIERRIDDLCRVVIPKEIRRTFRIRESDPPEIYTDAGGEVILKMFDYTKLESDGYSLTLKSEDLGAMLRNVIVDRYSEIEKHNIELDIDIPEAPVMADVDTSVDI